LGTGQAEGLRLMSDRDLLPLDTARRRIKDYWCAEILPPEARRILQEAAAQALTVYGLPRRVVIDEAIAEVQRRWREYFR